MNIGIFTDTYYPEINGVANSAYQLKIELENMGHNAYVFTVSNPEMKEEEKGVYRIHSIPCILIKKRRVGYSLPEMWVNKVKALNLDVIHTQTEFGIGILGRKLAKYLDIPVVHTYHTIYEDYTHYLKVPGNYKLKGAIRLFSRKWCNTADEVIVPTEKIKELLELYGVNKNIIVQPTGVDFNKFSNNDNALVEKMKKKYKLLSTDHVLAYVGRLSKEKNLDEIIDYLSRIVETDNNAKLVIVGEGPEQEGLERKVNNLGLNEHVIFTGPVSWEGIENYYALADMFVCASQSETQGLTYIEALAAGRPILVHNDKCLEGVLKEGINGYGYDSFDEFKEAYKKIIDGKYKETSSIEKIEKSIKNLSVEQFALNLEGIYKLIAMKNLQLEKSNKIYEAAH